MSGEIRVGTASWTDPTLIQSKAFYPPTCSSAEDRLRYYASRFPMVEVDSSYYGLPSVRNSELWAQRTPGDFIFNVKAFRLFTGHQTPKEAFPKDLLPEMAAHFAKKKNAYYRDVPPAVRDELWRRFDEAMQPLDEAGKLAALHFQFAPWVIPSPEGLGLIEEVAERMQSYQVAVEFRNKSWFDGVHDEETLQFERHHDFVHVVVDEPQVGAKCIPQVWAATSPNLAIVRLHGRNAATWDKKGLASASDRFDFDYTDEQLQEIAEPIKDLAKQVEQLHVVFNNNRGDQGQRNATSLMKILGQVRGDGGAQPPGWPLPEAAVG